MQIGIGLGIPQTALLGASSGPTVAEALAELNAFDATVTTWNPSDSATLYMSASRISVTQVAADGAVGQLFDQKGGNHCAANNDSARPLFTNGLTYDGLDDQLGFTNTDLPALIDVGLVYKGTDTQAITVADTDHTNFVLCFQDGNAGATNASAGTVSPFIDGVSFAGNRDALHALIADGAAHSAEARNITTSGFANITFSGYSAGGGGFRVSGILLPLYILDPAQADIAQARIAGAAFRAAVIQQLSL